MQPSTLSGYFSDSAANTGSRMWQPRSPSEPVPKSHHARHFRRVVVGCEGPHRRGPIHSFQSSVSGAAGGSFGRLDLDALRPDRPVRPGVDFLDLARGRRPATHSLMSRRPSPEWPWLPICVTTFCLRAVSVISRASHTACAIGFCT